MTQKRAAAYSFVWGVFVFITLVAAVVARDIVGQTAAQYAQPFAVWLPESTLVSVVIMAGFSLVLGAAFYLFVNRLPIIRVRLCKLNFPRYLKLELTALGVAQAASILFVCWLPIIILMYPTGLTVDTYNQLYQYQASAPTLYVTTGEVVNAEFIDHHPVFDTLLYGWFWSIGNTLGHQNWGLFLLVIVQSIVLAGELAALVCYTQRLGTPRVVRFVSLLFFALFPFVPHYAATILKDVTYLTFFIPWLLLWFEIFRTQGAALHRPAFIVAFILLGGFCILAKKTGVYLLAACLLVAFLALRQQRARIAAMGLTTLLVFTMAFPAIVYPVIGGVAPGGRQEALAVPIQQTISLLREDPQAFNMEELATLEQVLNTSSALSNYEAFRADGAKSAWRGTASATDAVRFVQLWVLKGLQYPVEYAESFVLTTGMLYIPYYKLTYFINENYAGRAEQYRQMNTGFAVDIAQPQEFITLNYYLATDSLGAKISDLPIISLFFTVGFYGSWLPVLAVLLTSCVRRNTGGRRYGAHSRDQGGPQSYGLAVLAPIVFSVLLFAVCPVASPRYVLPLLFTAPAYLAWGASALSGTIGHAETQHKSSMARVETE